MWDQLNEATLIIYDPRLAQLEHSLLKRPKTLRRDDLVERLSSHLGKEFRYATRWPYTVSTAVAKPTGRSVPGLNLGWQPRLRWIEGLVRELISVLESEWRKLVKLEIACYSHIGAMPWGKHENRKGAKREWICHIQWIFFLESACFWPQAFRSLAIRQLFARMTERGQLSQPTKAHWKREPLLLPAILLS